MIKKITVSFSYDEMFPVFTIMRNADDKSKNKEIKLIDKKLFKAYSKAHSKFIHLSDKLQKVLWSMGDDKKLYL